MFVWPSKAARDEKVDMKNLTFEPGMTEKEVKEMLLEEFNLSWCAPCAPPRSPWCVSVHPTTSLGSSMATIRIVINSATSRQTAKVTTGALHLSDAT